MFVQMSSSTVLSPLGTTTDQPWIPPVTGPEIREVQLSAMRARVVKADSRRRTEAKLSRLMADYRKVNAVNPVSRAGGSGALRNGSAAPRLKATSVTEAQRIVDNLRARETALGIQNHQHEARMAQAALGRLGLPVVIGL